MPYGSIIRRHSASAVDDANVGQSDATGGHAHILLQLGGDRRRWSDDRSRRRRRPDEQTGSENRSFLVDPPSDRSARRPDEAPEVRALPDR